MAIELKEILEMPTNTLNEIREKISQLKEALNEYTVGTEEQQKAAEELIKVQQQQKAAMAGVAVSADGDTKSFNALNAELRKLKEEWKATADSNRRNELTSDINRVKDQINTLNENIQNYQHNVGNYSESIKKAFGDMGISVSSLTAPLKKIGIDIESVDTSVKLLMGSFKLFAGQNLATLEQGFKSVSTSVGGFVKSLNGVKAAVLATGLGALLVLLGELVANWDSVTAAVERWIGVNQNAVLSAEQINATLAQNSHEIDFNLRLMKARGESEEAMIDYQIKANQIELERMDAIVAQSNALLENVRWWWERKKIIEQSDAAVDAIESLRAEQRRLQEDREVLKVLRQRQAEIEEETKKTQKHTQATKELIDANVDLREVQRAQEEAEKEVQEGFQKALDLQQEEIDKRKTAMELEQEDYERKLALLEEYHLSTEELTMNHEERMAELRAEVEQREYEELVRQRNAEKEIDEKRTAEHKKLMQARQDATAAMAMGTAGILKNLSAAMGENTKMGKGFAIASATIDTIASAVSGFRAGYNQWKDAGPMAWMAPVQAAINATAALVAGYAQVQKIASVDTSGNAQASGGGATALAIPNIEGLSSPIDYTRQVTTETEREQMNQDNRVYILESDIQQSNNRVRVREEETTF